MAKGASTINELILQRLDKFEDRVYEKLDKIEIQTTKTNGRVTALEKRADNIENFKNIIDKRVIIIEQDSRLNKAVEAKSEKQESERVSTRHWWFNYLLDVGKFVLPLVIGLIGYLLGYGIFR